MTSKALQHLPSVSSVEEEVSATGGTALVASRSQTARSWCSGKSPQCRRSVGVKPQAQGLQGGGQKQHWFKYQSVDKSDNLSNNFFTMDFAPAGCHNTAADMAAKDKGKDKDKDKGKEKEKEKEEMEKEKEKEKQRRESSRRGSRCQDFSYLKPGPLADGGKGGDRKSEDELQLMESILRNMQTRVEELQGEKKGDRSSEEIHQLQRHLRDLSGLVTCWMQGRSPPYDVRKKGKLGKLCGCTHTGRSMHGKRNPLADLKVMYERSLLLNPMDVSWPFIQVMAPKRRPINEDDTESCD